MSQKPNGTQRDLMRVLFVKHEGDQKKICEEYAIADRAGLVPRRSNTNKISEAKYAEFLLHDGLKKGWLFKRKQTYLVSSVYSPLSLTI